MEIINGTVNAWKTLPAGEFLYGKMEDGTQYYFIKEFSNGNRIASTSLKEGLELHAKEDGIDIAADPAHSVGLIDSEGNQIIPCNNRSIKVFNDDLLMVEPDSPIDEEIKKAKESKAEEVYELVRRGSENREKIKATIEGLMGPDAKYDYKFNNQVSGVTFYDVNGNNLVNGEYYSFVVMVGDTLFMAKNTVDTDVVMFSITDKKFVEGTTKEQPAVENINEGFAKEDIDLGQEVTVPVEEAASGLSGMFMDPVQYNAVPSSEDKVEEKQEEVKEDTSSVEGLSSMFMDPVENVPQEIPSETFDEIVNETPNEEIDNTVDINDKADDMIRRLTELNEQYKNRDIVIDKENTVEDNNIDIKDEVEDSIIDNMVSPKEVEEEIQEDNIFTPSEFKPDTIENYNDDIEDEDTEEDFDDIEDTVEKDTTMEDATKALSDLAQKYAEKDNELSEALGREEKLKASRKNYIEKTKAQEQKINLINSKNRDLVDTNTKLEAKVESLTMSLDLQKRKSEEQKRAISELTRENERLRSQLEGKEELARALESVKAIIGDNDSYSDDDSYYRRVA